MNWEAMLPGIVDAAGDLLVYALGEKKAQEKVAERAAILAARFAADQKAEKKFGKKIPPRG